MPKDRRFPGLDSILNRSRRATSWRHGWEVAGSLSDGRLRLAVGRRRDELGEPQGRRPLSVTPFKQAHDFLRRHAPEKRLVISGWGGVARHFAAFHSSCPATSFSPALSDNSVGIPSAKCSANSKAANAGRSPGWKTIPPCGCRSFTSIASRPTWTGRRNSAARAYWASTGGTGSWMPTRATRHGIRGRRDLSPTEYFQTFSLAQVRRPAAEKLA